MIPILRTNGRVTTYHYDVQDTAYYGSVNNRLMSYDVRDSQGELTERVWNAYDAEGKITRVIRKLEGDPAYRATRMVYNTSKQVEYVIGEVWTADGGQVPCGNYVRTYAWRFRYDSPRARYMRQRLNPTTLAPQDTSWSDFDGEDIYGDFSVASGEATMDRAYLTGIGELPDLSQSNPASSAWPPPAVRSSCTMARWPSCRATAAGRVFRSRCLWRETRECEFARSWRSC